MAGCRMRRAVDRSIKKAVSCGFIDLEDHAAPIAMLREMADFIDGADETTPALRYATPASFMLYCDALCLTPKGRAEHAARMAALDDGGGADALAAMRRGSPLFGGS